MGKLTPLDFGRRTLLMSGAAALLAPAAAAGGALKPAESLRSREAVERARRAIEPELIALGLKWGAPAFIRIFKREGRAQTWLQGADGRFIRVRNDPICAWSGALGPKRREGDLQAPEGAYFVTPDRLNPWSDYHLSFDLGYPNAFDRAHGRTGGYLMVHGGCASVGCYALGDAAIEAVYALVHAALVAGQPFVRAHCFPFRLTQAALAEQADDPNAQFWADLKPAFDLFERHRKPPDAQVRDGRYFFVAPQT